MQNDHFIVERNNYLKGKSIDVAISGGIAATEMVKVIRELRRWGATIRVYMSQSAQEFITPLSLEWASGSPVITKLTGLAEQISDADILLVAPATLNTIQKGVNGIADSPLLTNFAAAWGSGKPIVLAPAMHIDLWNNPAFQETLKKLNSDPQFKIVTPIFEEGKAKMASVESICLAVSSMLNKELTGRRFLLTGGPTEEKIDSVRTLRNLSSGKLSCLIAQELIAHGGEVEFVYGPGDYSPPQEVSLHRVKSVEEMRSAIRKIVENKKIDYAIFAAAVLDFVPQRFEAKLDSNRQYSINLSPGPKLIDEVKDIPKIGFKLESKITLSDMVSLGKDLISRRDWEACIVNCVENITSNKHEALFIAKDKEPIICKTKEEIAVAIRQFIISRIPALQPR